MLADSLAPPNRGEGWGEGNLISRRLASSPAIAAVAAPLLGRRGRKPSQQVLQRPNHRVLVLPATILFEVQSKTFSHFRRTRDGRCRADFRRSDIFRTDC